MTDDGNIVDFPNKFISVPSSGLMSDEVKHQANQTVLEGIDIASDKVKKDGNIVGGLVLLFEEDGTMVDMFCGSISISQVYLQLDRIKNDLIRSLEQYESE